MNRHRPAYFACRFPGCDYSARAPQPRGRHESLAHGMHKGVLNVVAELPPPQIEEPEPDAPIVPSERTAKDHLIVALQQLKERQVKLSDEIGRLEILRQEFQELARQQTITEQALESLKRTEAGHA